MNDKKTACITGATSGIGMATALLFAQNGYRIILTGRRKERLDTLATKIKQSFNGEVLTLDFDVRDKDAVERSLLNLPEQWRSIDILINNAGLAAGRSPFQEGVYADWEQMIDTNIKGLLYVSRTLLPGMCARKKGHILNICSIAGKEVYADGNVYCATKHAVNALSQAMRIDALPFGIKVTNLCPGAVETEFSLVRFKGDQEKAGAVYKGFTPLAAKDVADAILYCANLPAHVNINDLVIMPTAQANATSFLKE